MSKIVVGVDGSIGSHLALRWALDEARLRGSTVCAVHAWSLPHVPATTSGFVPVVVESAKDAEAFEQDSRQVLDEAVAEVAGEDPAVAIERLLVRERPAQALIEASANAELLVVGSRGHGGFRELLLGSVSHQCVLHATCPVVIVRKDGQ